jgi:hypothetical protein
MDHYGPSQTAPHGVPFGRCWPWQVVLLVSAPFAALAWIVLVVSLQRTRPKPNIVLTVFWTALCLFLTACTYSVANSQGIGP